MDFHITVIEISKTLQKIRLYPYFDVANYILMCCLVKEDTPQKGDPSFSRRHPLSCWLASMLMCFAGPSLSGLITGEGFTKPFCNTRDLLTATAVWYLINYFPFDFIYKLCKVKPLHLLICLTKEILRARKVAAGVAAATKVYGNAHVLVMAAGVLKGSGYLEMKLLERLVRGVWLPAASEILQPTATTKACTAASLALVLLRSGVIAACHQHHVFVGIAASFLLLKLASKLFGLVDPFRPFENAFCALFFGGLVDAVRRAVTPEPATTATAIANGASASGSGKAVAASAVAASSAANGAAAKSKEEKKND